MHVQVLPEYSSNTTKAWSWPQVANLASDGATAADSGTTAVTERSTDFSVSNPSPSVGLIGGAIGGAVAALALMIAGTLVYWCIIRKNRRGRDLKPDGADWEQAPVARQLPGERIYPCLLYTSDAADE